MAPPKYALAYPYTHYCVEVYLVLLQTVTGLAVYVCASSSAPYYANSKVGLITSW